MSMREETAEEIKEDSIDSTDTSSLDGSTGIIHPNLFQSNSRISSFLQSLLEEYKTQALIVETIKDELKSLEENPTAYFQNRKKFLYHGYTQSLDEFKTPLKFDVKVSI
jgi:hypothetical protein